MPKEENKEEEDEENKGDVAEFDQERADHLQAIKYALDGGKKDDVFIRMELMISCESLPLIDKKPPNTLIFMYLDQNALETEATDGGDKSASYTQSAAQGDDDAGPKQRYVEKLRSSVVYGDCNPIFEESFIFEAVRYDLITIKVDLYHQKQKTKPDDPLKTKKELLFMGTHTFNFAEVMLIKQSMIKKPM